LSCRTGPVVEGAANPLPTICYSNLVAPAIA